MSSPKPFFSVVVPVYNKAPFLERSIKSILAQTFTDFELILVNDASTDESLAEIQKFSDPRIRLFHRITPGPGGYAARNLGIANSQAEWVAFQDADDEWCLVHLDVLRHLTLRSRGGVVATGWMYHRSDGDLSPDPFSSFHSNLPEKTLDYAQFLNEAAKSRMPIWTGSVAARRSLLQDIGGFPEHCRRGGDTATWLRLVKAAGEVVVSTRTSAIYHRVDSFVTATTPPEVRDNCVYNVCRLLLKESPDRRVSQFLKRISNIHVSYGLRKRARQGTLVFSDCDTHYFLTDWKGHLLFRVQSLLPRRLLLGSRLFFAAAKRTIASIGLLR